MNLSDLVSYISTATGYVESDDQAACKSFLQVRERMIYDAALWKSSLVMVNVAVDPTNADNAEGVVLLPEVIGRPVAVRTVDNAVRVTALETYYRIDLDKFVDTGAPFEFSELSAVWFVWRSAAAAGLYVFTNTAADVGVTVKIIWRDANGVRTVTSAALALPSANPQPLLLSSSRVEVEAIYKPATNGQVIVAAQGSTDALYTLNAADTRSPSYVRLRLLGIPTAAVTLKVLGKAPYQALSFDQQELAIRNSENCLIAYGRGDLLRRGGENGAAQSAFQEAEALLQRLKDLEAVQAANNQRIIPDDGYGPEWGIGPYSRPYL